MRRLRSEHEFVGPVSFLVGSVLMLLLLAACGPTNDAPGATQGLASPKGTGGSSGAGSSGGDNEDGTEGPTDEPSQTGTGGGSGGGGIASGLPCNVQTILQKNCGMCHGAQPKAGAATTLLTWEGITKGDPKGSSQRVADIVLQRIKGTPSIMPPAPNPKLGDGDVSVLETWVRSGAPRSSESCGGGNAPSPDKGPQLNCTPDIKIRPATPYTVPPNPSLDQYVCYGFDVPVSSKRHVVAMAPITDNANILHHILLFESPSAYTSTPQECSYIANPSWKLVTGWAPGGPPLEFPAEAGWPMEKGTAHYVLQLHYNNGLKLPNQKDSTGYDFCSTDKLRANDAGILAFGTSDVMSMNFAIPPRRAKYVMECTYTLPSRVNYPIQFLAASPHMHKLGRSSSTYVLKGGTGSPQKVVDIENFSFESQTVYPTTGTATGGDLFKTRCGWTNPSDTTVRWGEGTNDEMCYNFVTYYPKIPDVRGFPGFGEFSWWTPSLESSCREVPQ